MTVVRPNSIAGINSITAQTDSIGFFKSDGTQFTVLDVNINASSGFSTVANLNVTGVATATSFSGDVTGNLTGNVNSSGISTLSNVVVGGATTEMVITGDLRVTGIITTGTGTVTIDGPNNRIGVGTATPRTTLDLAEETGGIALPQGTTAQRPTGDNPYLRWNTSNSALEFYNGTDWVEIISDYFPSGSTILG